MNGRFSILFSSGLLEAEVLSALSRAGVSTIDPEGFPTEFEWVLPKRPLSGEMRTALAAGRLRGGNLWHVANALLLRERVGAPLSFLTLDEAQRTVAAELGFATALE